MEDQTGFTLWELLWALLLGGVLLTFGVPSFERFALDARRTADINGFVTAIQLARSEAAKRGRSVVLCQTEDQRRCGPVGAALELGWMVFVNEDEARPPSRSPTEPLLYVYAPVGSGPIRSNRALYEFRAFRRRSTNGTITFCDRRGTDGARAVIVSYTGRPRVSDRGPSNRTLKCADFP